jgi:hypothetical protein
MKVSPEWIGITSLLYGGDTTCRIEVEEHSRNQKGFYNIYQLPAIKRLCIQYGYQVGQILLFVIQKDLDKPIDPNLMSTYTKSCLTDNPKIIERIQISGPLLISWYMLLIENCRNKVIGLSC